METGGGDPSKKRDPAVNKATPAPLAADTGLTVQPGCGFSANLIDDDLVINQGNVNRPDQDDSVTLSKSEFYVLVRKYAPWAGIELVSAN